MAGALQFRLPDIAEGVAEGEVVAWFVKVGDHVAEDDPMVEVMTDKATVTIGAPCAATVERLNFEVGATARVGQVLLVLRPDTAGAGATPRSSRPAATAVGQIEDSLPGAQLFMKHAKGATAVAPADGKPLAAPATRRLARELGVELQRVRATGPGGRVTQDDVRAAGPQPANDSAAIDVLAETISRREADVDTTSRQVADGAREERKPFVGMRRKIAERMHEAKTRAAHFTLVEECNVDALVELHSRLLPEATRRGVRLTYLPFVVKAVVEALRKHPALNSALDEDAQEIVYKNYYNLGIATATDAGLMVPVIRDVDQLRLFSLATEIERLAQGARQGTLRAHDLRDSTFTITSLGKQGGLFATPILNYPEVGILGVHQIKERPIVKDGDIVVGQVMLLSLSMDHRVVDGHVGAAFAYDVIDFLEHPERLFYEFL